MSRKGIAVGVVATLLVIGLTFVGGWFFLRQTRKAAQEVFTPHANALGGDTLTFLATGDVIAGIDLSQLKQEDIRRDLDGTIVVRLPASQVLVTRLDNRESHVINRKTGLFRRADVNMEGRARQFAETGIRNEAVNKGILTLASQNAEVKVAELLHMFGVQKVRCEAVQASPSRG